MGFYMPYNMPVHPTQSGPLLSLKKGEDGLCKSLEEAEGRWRGGGRGAGKEEEERCRGEDEKEKQGRQESFKSYNS